MIISDIRNALNVLSLNEHNWSNISAESFTSDNCFLQKAKCYLGGDHKIVLPSKFTIHFGTHTYRSPEWEIIKMYYK